VATGTGDEKGHDVPFERVGHCENDPLHDILPKS